jgi:predicted RNA polymerase sigma factor
MYRRLGRAAEPRASYEKALALTQPETGAAIPARADRQLRLRDWIEGDRFVWLVIT